MGANGFAVAECLMSLGCRLGTVVVGNSLGGMDSVFFQRGFLKAGVLERFAINERSTIRSKF